MLVSFQGTTTPKVGGRRGRQLFKSFQKTGIKYAQHVNISSTSLQGRVAREDFGRCLRPSEASGKSAVKNFDVQPFSEALSARV